MSKPRISILIPCHNAQRWVGQAIESALAQTYPHKEVVVLDDGSTDGSLAVIRSFGNAIHWETGPNRGSNPARNRLLELSSGDWVQYLDADDYLLPHKIAAQAAALGARPDADVLFSPTVMEFCEHGTVGRQEVLPIPRPHDPWVLLARWQLPQTGAALWRRAALVDVGGWKPDQPCCQEHELYLRLLRAGKVFVYCQTPGSVYRQWSTQTLCRRDPLLTVSRRLDVVREMEQHLIESDQLTSARRNAIAHARLESARTVYAADRQIALEVVSEARQANPCFRLPRAACFPAGYRLAYQALGFDLAEQLATRSRSLRKTSVFPSAT